MTHPPGTIVIPVSDQFRYAEFFIDYSALQVPDGTEVSIHRSGSVVQNLNESLAGIPDDHEWVWILGDDHVFPRELLMQLLENEVDVVVPLCVKRSPPFALVIMREEHELFDKRMGKHYPGYLPYQPHEVPDGLFTVVASGSAGMLIRRPVLDALGYPWFENTDGVYLNEDFRFCTKVREAGFDVWCDPNAYLGHIGQMHVWPVRYEGQVAVKVDCGGPPGMNEIVIGERASAVA